MQSLPQFCLLMQVLLPFVGWGLAATVFTSERGSRLCLQIVALLLAVSSLGLLWAVLQNAPQSVTVNWSLPGSAAGRLLFDRVSWEADLIVTPLAALLPWVALTALQMSSPIAGRGIALQNLLLLTSVNLALFGRDIGSFFSGICLTVLILTTSIARRGRSDQRRWGATFLAVQITGWFLIAGGLAALMGIAAVVRHAPEGTPGLTTASLTTLAELLTEVTHRNPAARFLWGQYQGLPTLLLILGGWLIAGIYPFHSWMFRAIYSASLTDRLWLAVWVKVSLLLVLRLLFLLLPGSLREYAWWGFSLAILGCVHASLVLLSHGDLPGVQSSSLLWTTQITLAGIFTLHAQMQTLLIPLVIGHLASVVLLILAMSILQTRLRSAELMSGQGLADEAPWLGPALLACILTLTMTPLATGLFLASLTIGTARVVSLLGGGLAPWALLISNLVMLAGLLRVCTRLLSGPLRLPEMSSRLVNRTPDITEPIDLSLNWSERSQLWLWGGIAVAFAAGIPWLWLRQV